MSHSPSYHGLMVHDVKHSHEEVIINKDTFPDIFEGDYIQVYHVDNPNLKLSLRIPFSNGSQNAATSGRADISLLKSVASVIQLTSFHKVAVEKVYDIKDIEIHSVDIAFRKQFLQRGNLWRYKQCMIGRTVHVGGVSSILGMQAQFQELWRSANTTDLLQPLVSGVITNNTRFTFRSRSTRLIWLIQISVEMWEIDQNGYLYFEKLLNQFVEPMLDKFKSLSVSHTLTVVFFARTLYVGERINPEILKRNSVYKVEGSEGEKGACSDKDGTQSYYEDVYKVVIENIADIDKVSIIKSLKNEFWSFPQLVGWGSHRKDSTLNSQNDPDESATRTGAAPQPTGGTMPTEGTQTQFKPRMEVELESLSPDECISWYSYTCVPSDALHGNFLGAINVTLNLLEKHFMDRDLTRVGSSIVMLSAGNGIFKVNPSMSLITKQRMMDNGIGLDFISLSSPPLHSVPLFLVNCSKSSNQIADFYEVPHWINVGYVDSEAQRKYLHNLLRQHASHPFRHDDQSSGSIVTSGSSSSASGGSGKDEKTVNTSDASIIGRSGHGGRSNNGIPMGGYYYTDPVFLQQLYNECSLIRSTIARSKQGLGTADWNVLGVSWAKSFRPLPFPSLLSGHVKTRIEHQSKLLKAFKRNKNGGGPYHSAGSDNPSDVGKDNNGSTASDSVSVDPEPRDSTGASIIGKHAQKLSIHAIKNCGGEGKYDKSLNVSWGFKAFDLKAENSWIYAKSLPKSLQLLLDGNGGVNCVAKSTVQEVSDLNSKSTGKSRIPLNSWGKVYFGSGFGERLNEISNLDIGGHSRGMEPSDIATESLNEQHLRCYGMKNFDDVSGSYVKTPSQSNLPLSLYLPTIPRLRGSSDKLNSLATSLTGSLGSLPFVGSQEGSWIGSPAKGGPASFDQCRDWEPHFTAGEDIVPGDGEHHHSASARKRSTSASSAVSYSDGGTVMKRRPSGAYRVKDDIFEFLSATPKPCDPAPNNVKGKNKHPSNKEVDKLVSLMNLYDKARSGRQSEISYLEGLESMNVALDSGPYALGLNSADTKDAVTAEHNETPPAAASKAKTVTMEVGSAPVGSGSSLHCGDNYNGVKKTSVSNITKPKAGILKTMATASPKISRVQLQAHHQQKIYSSSSDGHKKKEFDRYSDKQSYLAAYVPHNYYTSTAEHFMNKSQAGPTHAASHIKLPPSFAANANAVGLKRNSDAVPLPVHNTSKDVIGVESTAVPPCAVAIPKSSESTLNENAHGSAASSDVLHSVGAVMSSSYNFKTRVNPMQEHYRNRQSGGGVSNLNSNINPNFTAENDCELSEHDSKVEFYKSYRAKYGANPFRKEDGISYQAMRNQSRLRWAHVFHEAGSLELNWKSLSQPALLPLTTSFLPSVQDIYKNYEVAANYSKILVDDMNICGFDNHANLLMEMICQRLALDYQLVEGVPILEYKDLFLNINDGGNPGIHEGLGTRMPGGKAKSGTWDLLQAAAKTNDKGLRGNGVSSGHHSTNLNTKPMSLKKLSSTTEILVTTNVTAATATPSTTVASSSLVTGGSTNVDEYKYYILSMGHRIQFLLYDPFRKQISVKLWVYSKAKNSSDNTQEYNYRLWVPQYPNVEYGWSNSDEILLGNSTLEYNMANITAKRLRYMVIPDYCVNVVNATPPDGIVFVFKIGRSAFSSVYKGLEAKKTGSVADSIAESSLKSTNNGMPTFGGATKLVNMCKNSSAGVSDRSGSVCSSKTILTHQNSNPDVNIPNSSEVGDMTSASIGSITSNMNVLSSPTPIPMPVDDPPAPSAVAANCINTNALNKWYQIMKSQISTKSASDCETSYKGSFDKFLVLLKKNMADNEVLNVEYEPIPSHWSAQLLAENSSRAGSGIVSREDSDSKKTKEAATTSVLHMLGFAGDNADTAGSVATSVSNPNFVDIESVSSNKRTSKSTSTDLTSAIPGKVSDTAAIATASSGMSESALSVIHTLKSAVESVQESDKTSGGVDMVPVPPIAPNNSFSGKKKTYQYTKLWLTPPGPDPKWIYLKCDNTYSLARPFHIEMSWISCNSWLLEDFINILFRRCTSYNLRIVQMPEFFFSSNVQLHSFRAQPFIRIPCTYYNDLKSKSGGKNRDDDTSTVYFISPVLVVERIYLRQQLIDWIEDDEQFTDWHSVGVPIPEEHYFVHDRLNLSIDPEYTSFNNSFVVDNVPYYESDEFINSLNCKTLKCNSNSNIDYAPSTSNIGIPNVKMAVTSALTESLSRNSGANGVDSSHKSVDEMQETNTNGSTRVNLNSSVKSSGGKFIKIPPRKYGPVVSKMKDRQYILRMGNGGVRVGNNGFIWLLNMAVRISDTAPGGSGSISLPSASSSNNASVSNDTDRKEMGLSKLHEFHILCCDVGICLDILMEIVDAAFESLSNRFIDRIKYKGKDGAIYGANAVTVNKSLRSPLLAPTEMLTRSLPSGCDTYERMELNCAVIHPSIAVRKIITKQIQHLGVCEKPVSLAVDVVMQRLVFELGLLESEQEKHQMKFTKNLFQLLSTDIGENSNNKIDSSEFDSTKIEFNIILIDLSAEGAEVCKLLKKYFKISCGFDANHNNANCVLVGLLPNEVVGTGFSPFSEERCGVEDMIVCTKPISKANLISFSSIIDKYARAHGSSGIQRFFKESLLSEKQLENEATDVPAGNTNNPKPSRNSVSELSFVNPNPNPSKSVVFRRGML